jgi:hypothetical protein
MLSINSYCSTHNPQAGCKAVSGICKPMNSATLSVFKNLQSQINRVLSSMGKSLIGVDGRIGSGTVKSLNTAMGTGFTNCDQVSILADNLANQVKLKADKLGAPVHVSPARPPAPPSVPGPGGTVLHPESLRAAGFVGFITSPAGIATGIGTIVALYFINKATS